MSIVLHARMEFRRMGVSGGLALLVLGLTRIPVAAQEGHTTMTSAGSVGFYAIHRTPGPIHVDGNLDELGWQMAEQINGFQRILNDYDRIENSTRAKMLWDDTALYLGFACEDPDVWAIFDGEDDPMWSEEVVETFIDPDGDGRNYLELEVNPLNAWVDLKIYRAFPHLVKTMDWDIVGLKTAVQVHGTVNDSLNRDLGWTVEMAIPWTAMADSIDGSGRPALGDQWRLNLYRIERAGGRRVKQQIDSLRAVSKSLDEQISELLGSPEGGQRSEQDLDQRQQRTLADLRERRAPVAKDLEDLQKAYNDRTEYTAWSETWRQGFHDPTRFGVVRFCP